MIPSGIESYPESRFWLAHNKVVLPEIFKTLASDAVARVRSMGAMK